jgi:hypothetical protein
LKEIVDLPHARSEVFDADNPLLDILRDKMAAQPHLDAEVR